MNLQIFINEREYFTGMFLVDTAQKTHPLMGGF
jgi:hypothetical protein